MGRAEFLRKLTDALAAAGIRYMITGSVGSAYHGRGRATFDIDIVIDAEPNQVIAFVESLWEGCYASIQTALEALKQRTMFNVIDSGQGWKADLIVRKDRSFSRMEFDRRQEARIDGVDVPLVSAEDAILSKLEWAQASQSQRQYEDALGIAVEQYDRLDRQYLSQWAAELGVRDELERLLREAKSAQDGGGKTS